MNSSRYNKKKDKGIIPRMEIVQFAKEIGETLMERKTGFKNKYKCIGVRFQNCTVKMDNLLREGFGTTYDEALMQLAKQISAKVLIFNQHTDNEYSLDAPMLTHTAPKCIHDQEDSDSIDSESDDVESSDPFENETDGEPINLIHIKPPGTGY